MGISGSLAPDILVSFVGKASLVDTTLKYTSRTSTLIPYKWHFTVRCVANKPPAKMVSGNTFSSTTLNTDREWPLGVHTFPAVLTPQLSPHWRCNASQNHIYLSSQTNSSAHFIYIINHPDLNCKKKKKCHCRTRLRDQKRII